MHGRAKSGNNRVYVDVISSDCVNASYDWIDESFHNR
jgi:hypothetical protein